VAISQKRISRPTRSSLSTCAATRAYSSPEGRTHVVAAAARPAKATSPPKEKVPDYRKLKLNAEDIYPLPQLFRE
jgi:hypothetical protein